MALTGEPPDPARRYAWLSFLQWLPVGLTIVPMVLLLLERGFSLAEVAALGAVSAVTVGVLELPTGGLADVIGRKPVLIASAVTDAVALVILGLSGSFALLAVSAALRGVARALSSGPLEAWYVDTVQAIRGPGETSHLTAGLARGEVAASAALAVGTVAGGAVPALLADLSLPVPPLAIPVLGAAAVEVVRLVVTARIADVPGASMSLRAVLRSVPVTIGAGLRVAAGNALVLRLLLIGSATGVTLGVIELVTPGWLGELASQPERAALAYTALATVGFAADALGALGAPVARRRLRTPARASAAVTTIAVAGSLGLVVASSMSGVAALAIAGTAYVTVFLGLGAAGPPLGELLHGQVDTDQRATLLSLQSLLFQITGAGGAVLAGWLTVSRGAGAGFAVAVASMAAGLAMLATMTSRAARDGCGG